MTTPAFGTARVRSGVTLPAGRATLGRRQSDKILVPGSLALLDMGHSTRPAVAADLTAVRAVPTSGTKLQNLAALDGLLAAVGIVESANGCTFDYTTEFSAAGSSVGKSERSLRGGLHVIAGQTNAAPGSRYAVVKLDTSIMAYLAANSGHDFYASWWRRVTRNAPAGQLGGVAWSAIATGPTSVSTSPTLFAPFQSWTTNVGGDAIPTTSGGQRLGSSRPDEAGQAAGYTGPAFAALGARGWTVPSGQTVAPPTGNADQGDRAIMLWGAPQPFQTQGVNSTSSIFYRAYIEDLTVSGRTFQDVAAYDRSRFVYDVTNPNGKFFGDTTPTAPSAIA